MMSALPIREEVIARIKQLSDEQVARVLAFIETVGYGTEGYSEENDPMLNGELFFDGPPDLGERSEEILEQEFGLLNEMGDDSK